MIQQKKKIVMFLPHRADPGRGEMFSADLLPLELLQIATGPAAEGYEIVLLDAMIEENYIEKVLEACDGALCFASSCILGYQVYDGYVVAQAVRERYPDLPIIWGGWFPSVIPEMYLEANVADAVCIGQGEIAFLEIVQAIDSVGAVLAELGAEVETVEVSPLIDWHAVGRVLVPAEAFAIHEERLQTKWKTYGRLARNRLMLGSLFRAVDYIQAQRRRTELLAELEAVFARHDVVVTAGMLTPTPPLDDTEPFPFIDVPTIGIPFNLTAHPCHVVRAGFFDDGMPIGAQIAGRHWDEATVLRVSHAFEMAAGLLERRPNLKC